MDLTSGENNSISNHFKWSTFQALEEALKCSSSFEEKCVLWRQQSLIIKTFDENLACDFMRRHWLHQYFPEDNSDFQKYFGVSLFCDHTKHVEFPDIREISLEREPDSDEELFSADVMALLDHRGNCEIEKPSSKERNTMENFLQEQTKSENQNNDFCSARELLVVQTMMKGMQNDNSVNQRRNANNIQQKPDVGFNFSATKKSLGSLGRITNSTRKNFVSPVRSKSSNTEISKNEEVVDGEIASLLLHPALKNVDPKMVELINNEIIHTFKPVDWNEIAGLDYAKSIIKEAVVYPLLRPDIFTGLRRPPKGILLFGPPGTGKTLIGKCIASQSSSTFFSISSASLTSKWMGEGEKMVRALFAVAVARQPSVIFIDEIDSLLSQRSENENEGTRRLKTEFLVRLDGAATLDDDRVIIVGATNRPQELDEAVRRRFVKRLYVPLPEIDARAEILTNLLKTVDNDLNPNDIKEISELAAGYSGADMDSLCREASMEPLRSLPAEAIITFQKEQLRPVNIVDFRIALKKIRPSVSQSDLNQYVEWNKTFGSSY